MNHPGEIAILAAVTQPTVALVNNAQREHQEFMVSVEAVAIENAAVFDSLMPGGTKVYPADDTFTSLWAGLAGQHASSTFGLTAPARVWASDIDSDILGSSFVLHTPLGQGEVVLPVPGMHNVRNALAAAACALASGAPLAAVVQGLQGFRAANGRMQPHRLENGRVLIDDFLRGGPFLISCDDSVERHAGACNPIGTVCIDRQRNWFGFNNERHGGTLAEIRGFTSTFGLYSTRVSR
jgi:murE/murF fusion protein